MKVFLTGGTGYLGGRITRALSEAGHEVSLLTRRPQESASQPEGVQLVEGDLLNLEPVKSSMTGCDALIHAGALVRRWAPDRALFDRVNVDATGALLDVARDLGMPRVIYCSSYMALGPSAIRSTGNEGSAHDGQPRNDYERTKLLADTRTRRLQNKGEPIIMLYPGELYGPSRLTDGALFMQEALRLFRGEIPGTIGAADRKRCFSHVDDVAHGFLLALEKARLGTRYVLGGENLDLDQALDFLGQGAGAALPEREIAYSTATWVGRIQRWKSRLTGTPPTLTDEEVEIHKRDWAYSSQRAREELGYQITPVAEGLASTGRWLVEQGHLPRQGSLGEVIP